MNAPPTTTTPTPYAPPLPVTSGGMPDDDNDFSLMELIDGLLENRWYIGLITAAGIAVGAFNAIRAVPIYEVNSLIQVEDAKSNALGGMLGEAASQFENRSPISAEIEILRSRLVVGQAVENLGLDLSVAPRYVPLIGQWMARGASQPSDPALLSMFGMNGYVSGNEALNVRYLKVPAALQGQAYRVMLAGGGYVLTKPDGSGLGQGRFGQPLVFKDGMSSGEILVSSAIGNPGAEFTVATASRLTATQALQLALKITEQGRSSGIMRIGMESEDPVAAARIVNEISALYVRQNTERKVAEAEKSLSFLNTQLPQLRQQVEEAESKFNKYRSERGVFDLGTEAKEVLDQAVGLRIKLVDLQQKRKELDARYTSEHPAMQALDAQIKDLNARIVTIDARAKTLPATEQDVLRLTRDVKVSTDLYTSLLNSFQQLRLVKEGKVGNVRVIDLAAVAEHPFKPERSNIVAMYGMLGLLGGLGVAMLRRSLRSGIRDAADIESHLGLPVYATVPHSTNQVALSASIQAGKPGMHILATNHVDDPSVESLRSLRTALQFAVLAASNKIVLMTGPAPGIGKSFLVCNFAAVLAASGKRVLLIDGDLRKGLLHQYFGLERGHGLSELVIGTHPLGQVLHRNLIPKLDFLSTGVLPPNPAELLMSAATSNLLQSLGTAYDMVLIDSPPVLPVSDAAVLAPQAGIVFMVARSESTSMGELQEAIKRIGHSGVSVRGVVFNDVALRKRHYGGGYKYSHYRYHHYQYK